MAAAKKKTGSSRTKKATKTTPKRSAAAAKRPPRARSPRAAAAPATKRKPAARSGKKAPLKARRPAARPRKPAARPAPGPVRDNPQALALARAIAGVAQDKKALEVTIIDTRERGPEVGYDYVVVASGESDRQLEAISDGVDDVLRPQGTRPLSVSASPDWVLTDYGDVVAHFFTPDQRAHYDIEGLWATAPRVELDAAAPKKKPRSR